jgi:site-specific DNA recombinase
MRAKLTDRKTADGDTVYTYLCTNKERSRRQACNIKNARGNLLDERITEAIKDLCTPSEELAKRILKIKKRLSDSKGGVDDESDKLRAKIEENEKGIKALVSSLGKSDNADGYIINEIEEMHKTGDALRRRLSEIEASAKARDVDSAEFEAIRKRLSSVSESFGFYTVEQKRSTLSALVRRIVWDGENASLFLSCDKEYPSLPTDTQNIHEPLREDSE